MELVDTHAHLDDERFQGDLPDLLHRAAVAGVCTIVTVATTAGSSATCVELAAGHASLYTAVGIQPNYVGEAGPLDWDEVKRLVDRDRVVALGETGLDRHWDFTPFAQQEDFFIRHLDLAREKNLPVVIHCRKAEADVVRQLRERFDQWGPIKGVLHSFTGDQQTASALLAMGLYISFAGMVTYKNAQDLRQVAAQVPLDRLLVETDSPYLTPVPLRGHRNEPAYLIHTVTLLAADRGLTPEAIAEQTSRNARLLFRLP